MNRHLRPHQAIPQEHVEATAGLTNSLEQMAYALGDRLFDQQIKLHIATEGLRFKGRVRRSITLTTRILLLRNQ